MGNSAAASGNTVALDTDKTEVATLSVNETADHVINATEAKTVSFTVGGLDDSGTGTVTFSDGTHHVAVAVTGNGSYSVDLSSLNDGNITSSLSFTDGVGNSAAASGNTVALDTDKTEVATLSVNETADHVINATEAKTVSFTVGGLDDSGTGTVTFSDGTHHVAVAVTGNGSYSVDLSSLNDGNITSSLSFTDGVGNSAAATGNTVALDTDKTEVATLSVNGTADHVINATEAKAVSFTVGGLDDSGTGTVTFSNGTHHVAVAVTGNGSYSVDLSSLNDGNITSSLSFTDGVGNSAAATGNTVALDTDKTEVATLSVNETADHVINATEAKTVSFTVGGLDDSGTGTVTFSDGTHHVAVAVTGNGSYSVDLSSLNDGNITSSLSFTDGRATARRPAGTR